MQALVVRAACPEIQDAVIVIQCCLNAPAGIFTEHQVAAIEQRNVRKADKLYLAIDQSSLYSNPVNKDCRSRMNIPFVLADSELDKEFLALADKNGLGTLKGHRSVGGMRASIYNAMPEAGVDALIEFMAEFERTH